DAKPHAIAVSDKGHIAFTEWGANKIGVIFPDGKLSEYEILAPHKEPHGIVFDERGNILFALESGAIGKITF
ncbi:MAG: Virginiamycin B lyase, partial [Clostridiales Family XIII bacterium]|nr:Virginiamycin B lyase [Clostridiales Family XIII bacterium]